MMLRSFRLFSGLSADGTSAAPCGLAIPRTLTWHCRAGFSCSTASRLECSRTASLPPVVCHRFGMNQHAEQLRRFLLKPYFERGLHIVHARERHFIGQRAVARNVQPVTNPLELKFMYINHFRELSYNFL